jgi:hypothetical protein
VRLAARAGRPRVVDARSWLVEHADGRVSYCTLRRAVGVVR